MGAQRSGFLCCGRSRRRSHGRGWEGAVWAAQSAKRNSGGRAPLNGGVGEAGTGYEGRLRGQADSQSPTGPLSARRALGSRPLSWSKRYTRDYLRRRAARRFASTLFRLLFTGFGVSAASNSCRNPCANSSTGFPKAPSCPTRTIATDRCRSKDGGRNTFTESIE